MDLKLSPLLQLNLEDAYKDLIRATFGLSAEMEHLLRDLDRNPPLTIRWLLDINWESAERLEMACNAVASKCIDMVNQSKEEYEQTHHQPFIDSDEDDWKGELSTDTWRRRISQLYDVVGEFKAPEDEDNPVLRSWPYCKTPLQRMQCLTLISKFYVPMIDRSQKDFSTVLYTLQIAATFNTIIWEIHDTLVLYIEQSVARMTPEQYEAEFVVRDLSRPDLFRSSARFMNIDWAPRPITTVIPGQAWCIRDRALFPTMKLVLSDFTDFVRDSAHTARVYPCLRTSVLFYDEIWSHRRTTERNPHNIELIMRHPKIMRFYHDSVSFEFEYRCVPSQLHTAPSMQQQVRMFYESETFKRYITWTNTMGRKGRAYLFRIQLNRIFPDATHERVFEYWCDRVSPLAYHVPELLDPDTGRRSGSKVDACAVQLTLNFEDNLPRGLPGGLHEDVWRGWRAMPFLVRDRDNNVIMDPLDLSSLPIGVVAASKYEDKLKTIRVRE